MAAENCEVSPLVEASEQTREHARQLLFDGIFSPTAFIPPGNSVHRLL